MGNWLPDWLTGFNREAYDEGLQADAKNRQITEDLRRRGLIDEEDYLDAIAHYDASAAYDPDAAIQEDFDKELSRRTGAVRGFVGGAIGAGLKSTLGTIPWQIWLAVGAYIAWRLGLFRGLFKG